MYESVFRSELILFFWESSSHKRAPKARRDYRLFGTRGLQARWEYLRISTPDGKPTSATTLQIRTSVY